MEQNQWRCNVVWRHTKSGEQYGGENMIKIFGYDEVGAEYFRTKWSKQCACDGTQSIIAAEHYSALTQESN